MKILVVEDDEFVAQVLTISLTQQNYAVEVASDGELAWDLIKVFEYDLILLDVMLPKLDGINLCRRLRSQGYQMPVLLLTGKSSGAEKAAGLDAGADDYVVKPFDHDELIARVRALLRRGSTIAQPLLEWGELQLDPSNNVVTYGDRPLSLTPKEAALLELLLRNSRRVFSPSAILDHLWAYEEAPREEAVRTHIKGLRQKLKAAGAPVDLIETVYGIGYRLKPIVSPALAADADLASAPDPAADLPFADIWQTFQDHVSEQAQSLAQLVQSPAPATPPADLAAADLATALLIAHTLAGSLATFGLTEGAQLARQIEHHLGGEQDDAPVHPELVDPPSINLPEIVAALQRVIAQAAPRSLPSPLAPDPVSIADPPLLLVIEPQRALAETIVAAAADWGWRGAIATDLIAARDQIYRNHPAVVLFDLATAPDPADGLALLTELQHRLPVIPVVVWADANEGLDYPPPHLLKSQPIAAVLTAVTRALEQSEARKQRVMIVDDDPTLLAVLRTILEPWGLKIITLSDPRQFLATLTAVSPDLLILDIEMPYAHGIELCQQVRDDERWGGLPIIIFTAHTEATLVNRVLAAGADDFVSKPIVESELITRIIHRLEHHKLLRSLAETDPLTGLVNCRKTIQTLNELLRQAAIDRHPLCFVILSVRGLQQVNDRYGRLVGDAVVRQVGLLLAQSLPMATLVSRWGGKEFVIILDQVTQAEATPQILALTDRLNRRSFTTAEQNQIRITFNFGIAQYPEAGEDQSALYRSASAALEWAATRSDEEL